MTDLTRDEWVAFCRTQLKQPIRKVQRDASDKQVEVDQGVVDRSEDGTPAWLLQSPFGAPPRVDSPAEVDEPG